jgi:hypothetical protein
MMVTSSSLRVSSPNSAHAASVNINCGWMRRRRVGAKSGKRTAVKSNESLQLRLLVSHALFLTEEVVEELRDGIGYRKLEVHKREDEGSCFGADGETVASADG